MSSAGQIIGGVVGAVIGYFLGNPVLGASIGMAIGGAIDPPKGPVVEGPRLDDLSQQTSAYGLPIPRIYGNTAVFGNVFWIENNALLEVSTSSGGGGKGGGGGGSQQTKEYTYFATFALGLCEGEIAGVGRIWCNGKLLVDFGSTDYQTNLVTSTNANQFTVYTGSATQQPNPRMQAALGINDTPAYRGLAYIVVEDFPLKDYGNTLAAAQFKVEILTSQTLTQTHTAALYHYPPVHGNSSLSPIPFFVSDKKVVWAVPNWDSYYPASTTYSLYTAYPDGTFIFNGDVQCTGPTTPPRQQSESEIFLYDSRLIFPYVNSAGFCGNLGAMYESNGVWIGYTMYNHISGIYDPTLYVSSPNKGNMWLTIGVEFVAVTDGVYVYTVSSVSSAKYFINSGTLTLIYSGPGSPTATLTRASKVTIDKRTGRLLWREAPGVNPIWEYSDDLSSYSVYAASTINTYYYSNYNWYSDGQILVAGTGWTLDDNYNPIVADLSVDYFVLRIPTAVPVELGDIVSAECQKSNILTAGDIDVTTLTDQVRGYTIATTGALRASIEPLRGAWPFDIVQTGYKIKFLRRGISPSLVTIPTSLLAATSKVGDTIPRLTQSREMDTQIPYRVVINYSDFNREYDVNSQYSERLVTSSSNISTIEMPIVLTPDEAAQKCEILLYMYWLERIEFSFSLPPAYLNLEVSDIITIVEPPAAFVIRLTSIQYNSDGTMECRGRINNPTTYTSTAVGSNNAAAPAFRATIPLAGPAIADLLDIPVIFDQNDTTAFLVASSGISTYWAGANLYRTLDGGQTWSLINGFINESIIGYVTNTLAEPETFSLMDKSSVLVIRMFGGNTLSSVSELQLLNGINYFAYGKDKRWEIIGIQTNVLQLDGSYYGYNILRGRFGTEWAASLHENNDHLILLDTTLIQQSLLSSNQINLGYEYRIVESGADINDKTDMLFSYMGNNLECLSPVYASGTKNTPATNDWTLNWIRRTRVGGELRSYVDALLSETTEAYEVDIFSDDTYTTIKRTITGLTTPTAVYTSAQQTTDFGSTQSQLYVGIYQLSSTMGRGYPLLTSIPYKSSVLGLYHMESLPLVDEVTGNTYNLYGNASLSSTNKKFGQYTVYCDSAGYLGLGFANATALNDFTLEFFMYGSTSAPILYGNITLNYAALTLPGVYNVVTGISGAYIALRHYAICRKNGVVKVYLDGIQTGTIGSYAPALNLSYLEFGWYGSGPLYSYSSFDEVRLSNKCVYTTNFTPPNHPFSTPTGVY